MKPWFFLLILVLGILVVYFWPVHRAAFSKVYARVPADKTASLQAFRSDNPVTTLNVDGVDWEYLAKGDEPETILFLHGMTGSYDIWWQQIKALQSDYRVIAVTYPAVNTLEDMEKGVLAILDHEGVDDFNVVGTSLGGYFAQYLIAKYPDRIQKAVLANTFPPNDLIKEKNGTIGGLIPYLPDWLVMNVLRGSFSGSIYSASGNDELTLAFLNELSYRRVSRAQVAGRYLCVVEKFEPPVNTTVPIMIIEANNDPLVELALREQLKEIYPAAKVVTVSNGHFPYISMPDFYTQQLQEFFGSK